MRSRRREKQQAPRARAGCSGCQKTSSPKMKAPLRPRQLLPGGARLRRRARRVRRTQAAEQAGFSAGDERSCGESEPLGWQTPEGRTTTSRSHSPSCHCGRQHPNPFSAPTNHESEGGRPRHGVVGVSRKLQVQGRVRRGDAGAPHTETPKKTYMAMMKVQDRRIRDLPARGRRCCVGRGEGTVAQGRRAPPCT